MSASPYDTVPYKCRPIEWTAPERLAVASMLHGGPRLPRMGYRLLEIGCGDGANLLPQAYYRRHGAFVGLDGASTQIARACAGQTELRLSNVQFVHCDIARADARIEGEFDYIVAHGVFSWVDDDTRDALLQLSARRLKSPGLLYLNYNAFPGWKIRGMVRQFLMGNTANEGDLLARAELAQRSAEQMAVLCGDKNNPYSALMATEFRLVAESDVSYIAHEYLAEHNHAYWRDEFLQLVRQYGFTHVADADFNYPSGRVPDGLARSLREQGVVGDTVENTVDLLCHRQLHSPILTKMPLSPRMPNVEEFSDLWVASCLVPRSSNEEGHKLFLHPSGYEVEAKEKSVEAVLVRLHSMWPGGMRVEDAFPDVAHVMADLTLLHENGLIELRYDDATHDGTDPDPLGVFEIRRAGYRTSAYHTREDCRE